MNDLTPKRILIHLGLAAAVIASLACIGWILLDSVIMPRVARKGWPVVDIPAVQGKSPKEAVAILEALDLEVVQDPTRRASDKVPPDAVVAQLPEPGASVKAGHVVRLWLSAGPTSVRVPELAGRDSADAARALRESELVVADSVQWQQESDLPYGQVVSSMPKSGSILSRGSPVTLILSASDDTTSQDSSGSRIF
jgi:beta-lactam-binding protein with PASTA domain